MISGQERIKELLEYVYSKMLLNYDYFIVITGNEGTGKSRGLMLNMADIWYKDIIKQEPKVLPFCTDLKTYVMSLRKLRPYDLIALDEAGDTLDNSQLAKKFKIRLYQSYTVIRERKILSIIVLPSIFELHTPFARRRVRLLLHADKRTDSKCLSCGKSFVGNACIFCGSTDFKPGFVKWVAFNQNKVKEIIEINQEQRIKRLNVVQPSFIGKVGEYKGEWVETYNKMKQQKTEDVLMKLEEDFNQTQGKEKKEMTKEEKIKHSSTGQICDKCGSITITYKQRTKTWKCSRCKYEWPAIE